MEALILLGVYFVMMGSIVLLFSGVVSFFFPRIHFLVVVGASAVMGIIFSYTYELGNTMVFAVLMNIALSLIAVGLAKFGRYLKAKADLEAESLLN